MHWPLLCLAVCALLCLLAWLRPYWLLRVFYGPMLAAVLLVSLPFWLWRMARDGKYRAGLAERFGQVPRRVSDTLDGRPVVWMHAVSVGEVIAVSRLFMELRARLPEHRILLSTTTRTGQELARNRFGPENVFYFPLDFAWVVRRYMRAFEPQLLVLAETEFWPNMLWQARASGLKVAVVNARISDRSLPRYLKLKDLWRRVLGGLSLVLAQSELDAERLKAIGAPPGCVHLGGNLKYDVHAPQAATVTAAMREHLVPGTRLLVAGSTLEGEERMLLEAWPQITAAAPATIMVLAPRHPERFAAVAELLAESGVRWVKRSAWIGAPTHIGTIPRMEPGMILLLDSIGELASVYSLATLAFVGGSLVEAGGHNPLEPAQFAVPVVMGPNYQNFRAIVERLREHDGIAIVPPSELSTMLISLLQDRAAAQAMGERARQVFTRESGATARAVEALAELLVPSPAGRA